ncbi:MAG: radical SAM/Cys-rich domain protein [Nitrospira sp. SB0677_bin_15]|nr:radical SAM/Cys-rich domain protein [Nitrospira sp. SB0667_bin_9]MYD30094.1 radical SAM/Cys-rich domain protein [Nitrospira sp. SB0661_bin_20]MYG39996.1 radical SAM/Cys-rich domain protein [Nitrospira sp. SB0677_bin_15]MYH02671.1 radical SAM/Cys-rich domain protein [Nitrospira sp. SB0675_bin_23]MYJ23398.1 radical SAM/Cys-rich domain protein [Nitrospira sp. SB0673_bin_12]
MTMTPLSVLPNNVFSETLTEYGELSLRARTIHTLQVNVGKLCNQTCHHCHVDAGPSRTEIMSRETIEIILTVLRRHPQIATVDITGGAPEMNPHFEYLVSESRGLGKTVLDRCNLTVFSVKGKSHLPRFLAEHQVEIIASLPCYLEENVDQQRGTGVFARSLDALRQLNALGYGLEGTGLALNLVYNPLGAQLPPHQRELEQAYKDQLFSRFGIRFNHLYTITNMPINRFLNDLYAQGQYEAYMSLLIENFNPHSVEHVMCRSLLSVGWDGRLYDCDFNQMLDMPVRHDLPQTITEFDYEALARRPVVTGQHCYGCTAGAGSSCGGALA